MSARRPSTPAPQPADLLAWYDRHKRKLPWRAEPGEAPDPYRVWLSEIMLQQTTVAAVGPYFARFLARWPGVQALAAAPIKEVMSAWAGLGYYSRARNLHACAKAVVERHGGRFPADEAALLALPGIGPYTAAAIAAIAFGRPAAPVDGNIERVVARLFAIETPLPGAKPEIRRAVVGLVPAARPGDFAQAMMDLGATICTPRRPACALCPFSDCCRARAIGLADKLPQNTAKRERPMRYGVAFVVIDPGGRLLVRTRPPKGLLGGMTEVPTTEWSIGAPIGFAAHEAPIRARWTQVARPVTHVFTHFPLQLTVLVARLDEEAATPRGHRWAAPGQLAGEAIPALFRKVLAAAGVPPGSEAAARPESLDRGRLSFRGDAKRRARNP